MKVKYEIILSNSFDKLFSSTGSDFDQVMKIVELKNLILSHRENYNETVKKITANLNISTGFITPRSEHYQKFMDMVQKEVEIEFEKLTIPFSSNFSADDVGNLEGFVKFTNGDKGK